MFASTQRKVVNYCMNIALPLMAIIIIILPIKAFAQCANSTCISMNIIGTGQNALVDNAKAETKMAEITGISAASKATAAAKTPPETATSDCSKSPRLKTGAKVYRWYAVEKEGEFRKYDEIFCLSQGCSFQGGLKGSPECTTAP